MNSFIAKFKKFLPFVFWILLSFSVIAEAEETGIGINFNWWQVDVSRLADCARHPAFILRGGAILPQYDDANVRATVQTQLKAMRHAGFTTLRSFISNRRPLPHDPLDGPLSTPDGSLSALNQSRIQAFMRDIADAGFRRIEVVFGFQGEQNLYCRREYWGDCFDPQRTEEDWRWISEVTQAILATPAGSKARFDLLNEGCPDPSMRPATLANAKVYFGTIAARFQTHFGSRWLISCPDGLRRLDTLLTDLGEAGLRPRFVEIHSYNPDPHHLNALLDNARLRASQIGAQIIFGEMRYHSKEETAAIESWLAANPGAELLDAIEWPLTQPIAGTKCPIDSIPPYTPGPLYNILSRR